MVRGRSRDEPLAFMSYVRLDDKYEEGRLTEIKERLESEVRLQTGSSFPIFQDRQDIHWGQNWKERIGETLDEVTFLIPIVTPSFFQSTACRDELTAFLEREKQLQRTDLILPLYYVSVPELDDPDAEGADPLVDAIRSRQLADWRTLRFESPTAPVVGRTFADLAVQIRDALGRVREGAVATAPQPDDTAGATTSASPAQAVGPTSRSKPSTYVVDALMRGDFSSITEALAEAEPGARILVRSGLYQESVVIGKPVELIGDGDASEIVIQGQETDAIQFATTMGRLANVTIRQLEGTVIANAISIWQGRLEVEDCDITSHSGAGVGIRGAADPRLRRNKIHDCKWSGILVYSRGLGLLEDNDVFNNEVTGIEVRENSAPTVRRSRIHGNGEDGIYVYDGASIVVESSEIIDNGRAGVEVGGASATRSGASATLRQNKISRNGYEAIWAHDGGSVVAEDNDLRGNVRGSWDAEEGTTIQKAGNEEDE